MRGGEGLARPGDAEQHLVTLAIPDPLDKLGNRRRLVAGGLELRLQVEIGRFARAGDDHLADGRARGFGIAGHRTGRWLAGGGLAGGWHVG